VLYASVAVSLFSTFMRWRYLSETLDLSTVKREEGRTASSGLGALKEMGVMPRNVWVMTVVAGLSAFAARVTFSFTVIYAVEVIAHWLRCIFPDASSSKDRL